MITVRFHTTLIREYNIDTDDPEQALAVAQERHGKNDHDDEEIEEDFDIG